MVSVEALNYCNGTKYPNRANKKSRRTLWSPTAQSFVMRFNISQPLKRVKTTSVAEAVFFTF